jgi:tetratricopeptide (TPR) repeat protein
VGRADTLAQLTDRLNADGALVILTGYGGLGKTQTAVEFAHRAEAQFPGGVFWLRCAQPSLIAGEVAACGSEGRLNLPGFDSLPQPDKVALVQREWAKPIPRLLIFDNVEDPAVIKEWRPTAGGCRVLVTSRRGDWPPALTPHILSLPPLARADSLKLLAQADEARAQAFTADREADTIAESLGDLPLALHCAGAYMRHYTLTPAQYLAELRAQSALAHESLGDWLTQYEELPTDAPPLSSQTTGEGVNYADRMEKAVAALASEINKAGFPNAMQPLRDHLQTLAERADARGSKNAGWLFNELGYHLKAIADYAAARAASERALAILEKFLGVAHPDIATNVNNLGGVYYALGDLPAARAAFERALKIMEKYVPNNPNTKTVRENLEGVAATDK